MSTTPTPDLICPVCGTVNPATRQFCRRCAADLRAPVPDATAPVETRRPVPVGPIIIGGALVLAVALIAIVLLLVLGGSPAATPTPGPTSSAVPGSASPSTTSSPSVPPTAAPVSDAPATVPPPTVPPASVGTGDPVVDTLTGPRRASCTGDNGTGTPGYIHLEWTASNTTGVRLSIDPPAPNDAYDYGYDDYAAVDSDDVPFTCDPPNSDANGEYHLYVVTTLHDNGRFAWRFLRVYIRD